MRNILLASVAIAALGFSGSAFAGEDDFDVTATTAAALTVDCTANLRFGTVAVAPDNTAATITVLAASGAEATSNSDADALPLGVSGPAACTVANEVGGGATASLSDATVALTGGPGEDLNASLTLSDATGIGNETLYVGGALTIPGEYDPANYGAYAVTVTLTVSD